MKIRNQHYRQKKTYDNARANKLCEYKFIISKSKYKFETN